MKTSFVIFLFVLPLAADSTSIDLSAPVLLYQDGLNAQFTPVISITDDGFAISVNYVFDQSLTQFDLGLEESFTITQPTMVALDYIASGLLYGGACTRGYCPGMKIGFSGFSQIGPVDPVQVSGSGSSSTPYLGQVQASGENSGAWLLDAGTYDVFQFVQFTASDAGVSSNFQANLGFTITDPPLATPEPRWAGTFGLALLLAAGALLRPRFRKSSPVQRP